MPPVGDLTRRERVRRALRHQPLDRLPTQVGWTSAMGRRLAEHFGRQEHELPRALGNHLVRVDLSFEARRSADGRVRYDWWGAGHDADEEGYFIRECPLAVSDDLEAFPWPDPWAADLFDAAAATCAATGDEAFVVPNLGFALFERAWSLRGFEPLLLDLAADPGYVAELLDRITDIQLVLIGRYLEIGVDGGYFGDDYGAQASLLFSPGTWRALVKPRLARLFAPFVERDLPVLMHSDGAIADILPDLLEIGLTALNPVQPEVLEHPWLRETFGQRLAFHGGISTQTVLPRGTPEQVRAAVAACRADLAPDGTGLLLAPSHRLMTDIPMANVEALLDGFGVSPGS
jgi:uroporphyrinogen decarboxylase